MDTSWMRDNIRVYADSRVVGNLASPGNFARFYFHKYVCVHKLMWVVWMDSRANVKCHLCRLFPGLKKAIYLDSDVIVKHDIHNFWNELQLSNKIIIAVKRYGVLLLYM